MPVGSPLGIISLRGSVLNLQMAKIFLVIPQFDFTKVYNVQQ